MIVTVDLNPREAYICSRRYRDRVTWKTIGLELDLPPKRCQQIAADAHRKLGWAAYIDMVKNPEHRIRQTAALLGVAPPTDA